MKTNQKKRLINLIKIKVNNKIMMIKSNKIKISKIMMNNNKIILIIIISQI